MLSRSLSYAKIMRGERRTSNLFERYAEPKLILYKVTPYPSTSQIECTSCTQKMHDTLHTRIRYTRAPRHFPKDICQSWISQDRLDGEREWHSFWKSPNYFRSLSLLLLISFPCTFVNFPWCYANFPTTFGSFPLGYQAGSRTFLGSD